MKFLIISGEPNPAGLFHSILQEIGRGAEEGGAEVSLLAPANIGGCRSCNEGWGPCKTDHYCAFGKDGFEEAHNSIKQADALCIIVPIHWGEMPETVHHLLDRLGRCESGRVGVMAGKPLLVVSSPGGSGNALLSCLEQMERFCRHTGAVIFDYLSVNQWNSDYKKISAYSASRAMAFGRKVGEPT